ncbi:MAG TPA: energy transducer TonB [Burkholderiales bacterium]|nr:energy transducer TonB [Burkholderiales bacterium]
MQIALPPAPDERRFIAASVAASVAFHAAVLVFGPGLMHEHPLEPPRVLSVLLQPEAPAREEVTPPAPPPPARRPPPRPAPQVAPRTPPPPAAPPPLPAAAEAIAAPPLLEAGPKQEQSAPAQAIPAAPAQPVATAPREAPSPPDFRAAYLRNPAPTYPTAARRNGEEGTVTLRVLVSTVGAPREVVLERSSGSSSLDAVALATVKTWRFTPARRAGKAEEAWVLVPIVFRLEPRG